MDIAIVAATDLEIAPFRSMPLPYSKGKIIWATTGVGAIPTTFSISRLIAEHHPSLIIQIGIAGCFDISLPIGSAVAVASEIQADMGVMEDGIYKDVFQMGLTAYDAFPYQQGCLNNPHTALIKQSGLTPVKSISVNEISTHPNKIELFHKRYGAQIESMEGAAFHYACLCSHTPFIQLRGISNVVGIRDKKQWNIPDALHAVRAACCTLLESL